MTAKFDTGLRTSQQEKNETATLGLRLMQGRQFGFFLLRIPFVFGMKLKFLFSRNRARELTDLHCD